MDAEEPAGIEVGDVIVTMDQNSTILFVNAAVERIFGYMPTELVGQKITMLMPEPLRQRHIEGMRRYLETGEKLFSWGGVSFPGLHKSGREINLEIAFAESRVSDMRVFTGIMRDVSERNETLRALERSNAELAEFAYVASHDLSEPLRTITNYLRLLRRRHGDELVSEADAYVGRAIDGAERLRSSLGVPRERIRVIPHGAFEHLTRLPVERPLPPELAAVDRPVILFFGYLSRYKGVDVLLEAFAQVEGAELWVAGVPRVDMDGLHALAERAPGRVRFIPRFVEDEEVPALFRRADLVVLPYREIDQSGVLYTALAFGRPLVVTRVGGLPDLADCGAAVAVPPEDPGALAAAIAGLIADPDERSRLAAAAERAARTEYSWDEVARRHLELYRELAPRRV